MPEPDLSFHSAWLKVRWAEQQIKQLVPRCNSFIKEHTHAFAIEGNPDGTWSIVVKTDSIPGDIPLLAGDVVHNLNSALDYCWMGLHRSVDPKAKKLTMPRGDRWEEVKGAFKNAATKLVLPHVVDFVLDAIQPYNATPDGDGNNALWLLGKFDNWNKHNLLIVSTVATHIKSASIGSEFGAIKHALISECSAEGARRLFTFKLPPGDRLIFQREPDITFAIIVSTGKAGEEGSLVPLLGSMLHQTARAVKLFHATFAKNPLRKLD
jgi:hypothetical protein